MKRILLFASFMAGISCAYAQTMLKGRVVDLTNNTPLPAASVSIPGKATITTDSDGYFSIECESINKITVSYLGYETQTRSIKNCNEELLISLRPASKAMNEVEITATSSGNKALIYQPVSITKLSPVELKRGMGLFLDDAINQNVPGVTMNRRTVSAGQQFNIRGYGNGVRGTNGVSSNFDGQGYKVYLNGIPVTDAEGITLMDDIDFFSIENVEVVKGPSGTLYGLAIAGVVNLKTIKPERGKTTIGQEVMVGSLGIRRYTTTFSTASERSSILINYGNQKADGFMAHTASDKQFVHVSGEMNPSEKQSLNFYAGYINSYEERGGELTITQYNNRDYSGNPAYIQRNAHSEIISARLGIGHTYRFSQSVSNSTTVFGTGISNNAASAAGWTDKDPINYGLRSTFDTRFSAGKYISVTGITGVELQRQHAQVIGYNMKADPANPTGYFKIDTMRSNQAYITGTASVFTEWTLNMPKGLSITAGAGWSSMNIELNDRFIRPNYSRPQRYEKDYTKMVSPHFAINKVFNNNVSVYGSYSTGYKAPVSSYFFVPVSTTVGFVDSTLRPEKGTQYEIGSKGSLLKNRLVYQLALFQTIFSNKMTAVAVPLDPPAVGTAYSYVTNGGKQDHKGVEILVKYTAYQSATGILRLVRPFANVTYSDFEYVDYTIERLKMPATGDTVINYSGNPVAGVAPWVANAGIDVQTLGGIYFNFVYSYKDAMPITSDNLNRTKSFYTLNTKFGIARNLSSHFDLDAYVGINNITNTQFYYMVFVNQLPDAYIPAARNAIYFGGVNLKYHF